MSAFGGFVKILVCTFLLAVSPCSLFAVCNDSWSLPQSYGNGPEISDALQKAVHDFSGKVGARGFTVEELLVWVEE
jgi:hypothetical protein